MKRVLIAGCGYVGSRLGELLHARGDVAYGLRRDIARLPAGIRPLRADLLDRGALRALPERLDAVVYAAAAAGSGDDAYRAAYVDGVRNLLDALAASPSAPPGRLIFVSSTGVWRVDDGSTVDEDTPLEPVTASNTRAADRLVEGEALVAAFEGARDPPVIVRFSGIYGPGREGVVERVRRGEAVCHDDPPAYTNRIHRDDCAGVLRHLIDLDRPQALYLASDCEPCTDGALYRYVARLLGAPIPPVATAPSPRGRNKRCSNARLLSSGYAFAFPTYREGYRALLSGEDPAS